jgi:hypothetical protein
MQQFEFVKATNLDEAWSNFDPLAPLPGEESSFYVPRPGEPLGRLTRALLHTFTAPPKFFFAGYRGSGKSTELNRLRNPLLRLLSDEDIELLKSVRTENPLPEVHLPLLPSGRCLLPPR